MDLERLVQKINRWIKKTFHSILFVIRGNSDKLNELLQFGEGTGIKSKKISTHISDRIVLVSRFSTESRKMEGLTGSLPMRLLVHSAKQVVQVTSEGERVLKGSEMKTLKILNSKPGDGLSIVVNRLSI